mmetsp:Transcript_24450/g.66764  ORF Transcript_24450/g.66764 Transcript_24450/m.66764 type:complete len:243 (+) Transcript_24450:28-756(+)
MTAGETPRQRQAAAPLEGPARLSPVSRLTPSPPRLLALAAAMALGGLTRRRGPPVRLLLPVLLGRLPAAAPPRGARAAAGPGAPAPRRALLLFAGTSPPTLARARRGRRGRTPRTAPTPVWLTLFPPIPLLVCLLPLGLFLFGLLLSLPLLLCLLLVAATATATAFATMAATAVTAAAALLCAFGALRAPLGLCLGNGLGSAGGSLRCGHSPGRRSHSGRSHGCRVHGGWLGRWSRGLRRWR